MAEDFEAVLTGGHPNSLGRTVEVVDVVLADRAKLAQLYACYFSEDEVVRLRFSSAMKRVAMRCWFLSPARFRRRVHEGDYSWVTNSGAEVSPWLLRPIWTVRQNHRPTTFHLQDGDD